MKDLAVKYLVDTTARWNTYHNHKETSAWAGIVLFVFLVIQLTRVNNPGSASWAIKLFLTVVVAGAAALVLIYLRTQFFLRSHAADVIAACSYLSARLMATPPEEIVLTDWTPAPDDAELKKIRDWRYLPTCVLRTVANMQGTKTEARPILESIGYALVIITTLFGILQIWHSF